MTNVQAEKLLFVQRGQIREKVIDKNIAVSWRKSKLFGLLPDSPVSSETDFEVEESNLSEYCERLIPEYISFFISNTNGVVMYRRVVEEKLSCITDLSERSIGTTSFSVAMLTKKDALVKKDEHYLNYLSDFTSRTILIPSESVHVTLFYDSLENEYLYMSIRNSLLSFVDDGGVLAQAEKQQIALSNYLNLDEYLIDKLDDKLIVAEGRFPLLIYGRDSEYLAWYLSDKMLMPTLRVSHKGIPVALLEEKLVDYSKKSSTLIIAELSSAPEKYLTLVAQIVDYMIESGGKRKKQIILTSSVKPENDRIMAKLGMYAIDLDSCLANQQKEEHEIKTLEKLEQEAIESALIATGWNPTVAAKKLGIGRATLYRKMKLYQFENKERVSK